MQYGWCAPVGEAAAIKAAGFDYIEVQLVPMRLEDDGAYARARAAVDDLPLPAFAFSYLFPHDLRVVGPQRDDARARRYFDRVVDLLDRAGAKVVVFGSGWVRNVPEGGDAAQAEEEFLAALSWCADALGGTPTMLIIEPQNRKETNLVNTVAEAARLARLMNRPNVRALADFYHVDEEREPLSTVREHGPWLGHIHLADTGRLNPGTGSYDYDAFFRHLKAGGYSGLLSTECRVEGDPKLAMAKTLAFLKAKWARA